MKTVLITGIDSGIGKALAEKFLAENFFVIGASLVGQVDLSNENLKVFKLDLLDQKSIEKCADDIKSLGKNIDIHINNAGILLDDGEPTIIPEKLRKTLEVNVVGPINLTERIIPMVNVGGHIVNISSSAGSLETVHHANYPAYKISKCALNMFTSYLAFRLKGKITVSSVHPGRVKTGMGSWEGDMTAEEAAKYIFETATKEGLETGQFWFKGEKFPW